MNEIEAALAYLRSQKLLYDAAIAALERVQVVPELVPVKKKRGRKSMTSEEREQVSRRMRKFWANRKEEHVEGTSRSGQPGAVGGIDGRPTA